MEIVNNQLYVATVTDQGFANDKEGNPFFKLYFRLKGKVKDKYNPDNFEPVESFTEYNIQFRFVGVAPNILEWRLKDLQQLGLKGDDLSVLDPNCEPSEDHVSFVGRQVVVTPNVKENGDKTVVYWNLVFPKKDSVKLTKDKFSKLNDLFNKKKEPVKEDEDLPFN